MSKDSLDGYEQTGIGTPLDPAVMETGNRVGEIARSYFGEYKLVTYDTDKERMVEETRQMLTLGDGIIAEASFLQDGLFCSVDILRIQGDECSIVEVKSSTETKEVYIDDLAFQYYVLAECGLKVSGAYLLHINSDYVRNGPLDIKKLFCLEDHTEEVLAEYDLVGANIENIRDYLQKNAEEPKQPDLPRYVIFFPADV